MTSGRRAKQRRQVAAPAPVDQDATPIRLAGREGKLFNHPLGEAAAQHRMWQGMQAELLPRIIEANRKALLACTGQADCPSGVHRPDCWVAR